MKVRQLVGRFAGKVIDMPYHVAQSCLAAGTVEHPDRPVRVRGLDAEGKPVPPPEPRGVETIAADRMMRDYVRKEGARQFHPLDHDRDGAPGGSLPAAERDVCDDLRAEYERKSGGQTADKRWGERRLRSEIAKLESAG